MQETEFKNILSEYKAALHQKETFLNLYGGKIQTKLDQLREQEDIAMECYADSTAELNDKELLNPKLTSFVYTITFNKKGLTKLYKADESAKIVDKVRDEISTLEENSTPIIEKNTLECNLFKAAISCLVKDYVSQRLLDSPKYSAAKEELDNAELKCREGRWQRSTVDVVEQRLRDVEKQELQDVIKEYDLEEVL